MWWSHHIFAPSNDAKQDVSIGSKVLKINLTFLLAMWTLSSAMSVAKVIQILLVGSLGQLLMLDMVIFKLLP